MAKNINKIIIKDEQEWFRNELLELKIKHPFFSWYYPKWLAFTEWLHRWI